MQNSAPFNSERESYRRLQEDYSLEAKSKTFGINIEDITFIVGENGVTSDLLYKCLWKHI